MFLVWKKYEKFNLQVPISAFHKSNRIRLFSVTMSLHHDTYKLQPLTLTWPYERNNTKCAKIVADPMLQNGNSRSRQQITRSKNFGSSTESDKKITKAFFKSWWILTQWALANKFWEFLTQWTLAEKILNS